MATSIEVEIEHRRYVELCPAARRAQGSLGITTLELGQRRAQIKLFAATPAGRTLVETIDADALPAYEDRLVPMQLTGVILRGGKLHVRLYVEGALFLERTVPVARYIRPSNAQIVATVLALLILLGGLGALFISRFQVDVESSDTVSEESDEAAERADAADADRVQPGGPDSDAGVDSTETEVSENTDESDDTDESVEDAGATTDEQVQGGQAEGEQAGEAASEPAEAVEPRTHIVYFNPESAELTDDTRDALLSIAERLSGHDLSLRVDGHTAIAGSMEGRVQLSRRRAEAVRDYLVVQGIDPERFSELNAFGAARPVTRDLDDQDPNRRVEIIEIEDGQ